MTQIIRSVKEWTEIRSTIPPDQSVGFVPTMGALHQGHLSLIDRSRKENAVTVVSIYVNPTQFNDAQDLERYPRTDEADMALLTDRQVEYVFFPNYNELYPDDFTYKITEQKRSRVLEGASRPGHFDGVLTVVMKLLNIIRPARSYFGEKDYQQYMLIARMCEAFFMPVQIIVCPTVRDDDGLALSSRNRLLTEEERQLAATFPEVLKSGNNMEYVIRRLEEAGFHVEYVAEIDHRRYGAIRLGSIRLIDNFPIKME